jgi:hypothetical protein
MIDGTATLRGLTIGAGTVYGLRQWPSVLSTATIRSTDDDRPRANGVVAGDDYYGSLSVSFDVQVKAGSQAASELATTALTAAFRRSDTDVWLTVRVKGNPSEYALLGRPRGVSVAIDRQRFLSGLVDARCVFVATDPLKYGTAASVPITLASTGAGLSFPATFPAVFAGTAGVGIGSAPNIGTEQTGWTATLEGPLVNPRIEHVESGWFVKLNATIAAGQTVVLDSRATSIMLSGVAARPSWQWPGSRWFQLAPGANSIRFSADTGDGIATINYRPAWA